MAEAGIARRLPVASGRATRYKRQRMSRSREGFGLLGRGLVIGAVLICATTPTSAVAAKHCRSVTIDYQRTSTEHYSRMQVTVKRGGISCPGARHVMRRYVNDQRPCPPDGGNTCGRRYRDGWFCYAPTAQAFPLIQGCERGRGKLIEGHARP
jgi:hypothetical protein